MSDRPITEQIRERIAAAIPDAQIEVSGSGGHFNISVTSRAFEGQRLLAKQRLVYSAIADLMKGDAAPVHAVDRLETLTPS